MEFVTGQSAPLNLSQNATFQVAFIANGVWETMNRRQVEQVELTDELVYITGAGDEQVQVKAVDGSRYYWATDKSVVTVAVVKRSIY